MRPALKESLAKYVPVQALDELAGFIVQHGIHLKVRRGRLSKLGDFRPSRNGAPHIITVNGTLNIYAFLLVFYHELAHLLVWQKFGRQAQPHGNTWKETFGFLLREACDKGYFHQSISQAVYQYSFRVKAAGLADAQLQRLLQMFDKEPATEASGKILLEDVPENAIFMAANGRLFKKAEKLRKRFRCLCLTNKRNYLFHPLAEVTLAGLQTFRKSE